MSLTTIKNENGIYVDLSKNKINFVSKEAEIIFDLSMKNESLEIENAELKKQLQIKAEGFKAVNEELCEYAEKNEKLKTQQQEFIKYLEDMLDDDNDIFSVIRVKDVLNQYKEIIGKDINVNSKGENTDE